MDIYQMKIKNSWILLSLSIGIFYRFCIDGWCGGFLFFSGAVVPLGVLGWMFYFRMLGAGDIKLFCVLGGIMGASDILHCIWIAFLIGAVLSAGIFLTCGGFLQRLAYLADYLKDFIRTRQRKPYYHKGMTVENIHFTVPIFMSVMLYVGGIY